MNRKEEGFDRAMGEAKRQASNVADAANTAARKTASSFETALRELIENQPYTAVADWRRDRLTTRPATPTVLTPEIHRQDRPRQLYIRKQPSCCAAENGSNAPNTYERTLGATVDLYKIDHTYRVPVRSD